MEAAARLILVIALVVVHCVHSAAQDADYEPQRASEIWFSASFQANPFKELGTGSSFLEKVKAAVELGYRTEDLFQQHRNLFTDITLRRKINDYLAAGVEYRYSARDADTRNQQRYQIFLIGKTEVGQFDIQVKTRFQSLFNALGQGSSTWRNRVKIAYRTPGFRVNPEASVELFTALGGSGSELAGVRYALGGNVNLPNGQELDLGFRYDREIGVYLPRYTGAFILGYSYEL